MFWRVVDVVIALAWLYLIGEYVRVGGLDYEHLALLAVTAVATLLAANAHHNAAKPAAEAPRDPSDR